MTLDNNTIKMATGKKFTEFSKNIKDALINKMASHPDAKTYSDEIDFIHTKKDQFKEINSEE
jgi:hypothetical protein